MLLNPLDSPGVVPASNRVASQVTAFQSALEIDGRDQSVAARRWLHAADELRNSVIEAGAHGVDLGKRIGVGGSDRTRSLTNRVASGIADPTAGRSKEADD